ncbi:hypothetical protein CAEBREN_14239 [Caenorhabditis brenneri]|uniref:Chitin-binding type-2 domain-containing protein n=1 Tax=Caenorhabditis brenneri TaxID=135651 RepID=G0MWE1_CAEBE|nr:hypothetical protein CAEBREN_14239 [Caenorhabditis brenneri]
MRQLSFLVTTVVVLASEGKNFLNPKGPACPEGDGLYAVGCSTKYLQCVNNVEFEQSCPEGLYFDRLMARCERRAVNHLCNDANVKTLNVRQKAVAIDCAGRLNGDYPLDKNVCNENYYQCANGISYMRKCPFDQVYTPSLKRCDYVRNCKPSEVKSRFAAAYYSPTAEADNWVVTTKEFENGYKGIDCTQLGDSYFTEDKKCSPFFFQCANGKLFRKTCPEGLMYVLSQNLCDFPQAVKGCPQFNGKETAYEPASSPPKTTTVAPYMPPAAPSVPAYPSKYEAPVDPSPYMSSPAPTVPAYIPPKTTERYTEAPAPTAPAYIPTQAPAYSPTAAPAAPVYAQPTSYEPSVHGDCSNKEDGFHEIKKCHSEFLTCTGGIGRVVSCNNNLVYDVRISSCEYEDACKGPRKQEDVPVLYNHGGAYNDRPPEIKVDFDCTGKANGVHFKEACTNNYFRCQDGRAFAQSCPPNLVYNKAINTCDYADNCEKNYMEPSRLYDTPAPTVKYQPSVVYTTQPPKTVAYTQPPRDTERPSTIYVRTTTVGYEEPSTTRAAYTTPAAYTNPAPTVEPISLDYFSCDRLIDGNHASGLCKNVFYTCSNNVLTATRCPGDLVFNPYIGDCDYRRNLRDCQGYQPNETTTVSYSYTESTTREYSPARTTTKRHAPVYSESYEPTTTPSYAAVTNAPATSGYAQDVYKTTLPPPHYSAFCERLGDGNYGMDCENYFYTCYQAQTFKNDCPAGLFYSVRGDRCDHKEKVEGCPGFVPSTPSTTPYYADKDVPTKYGYKPDKYPNIDYTTTTPGPVDTTPIAEAFSCYQRPDGIYGLPYCSKDYVQCMFGRSLVSSCASGLFYSEMTGLCDYKANVPICKIPKGSDAIDNNACLGKEDGYYSAGCSSHYFSCIDETTRKMSCPNKLKFSKEKGICTYATDVSECSISKKPETTPPPVAMDFCTIRPNGLHALKQCSSHYVVCDNSRAIVGTCAAPLVFNMHNQLCDYRSNNKDCEGDYIPSATDAYSSYTTKAQEPPQTTTHKPYQPQTTHSGRPYYKASTTTTRAYETTSTARPTTTTTRAYEQPTTTTTKAYEQPTTTTEAYQPPSTTTTTAQPYETTTPARDIEVPTTTTSYQPPQETTTTPARDVTTTTAPYVAPTTTAQKSY